LSIVQEIFTKTRISAWAQLSIEDQAEIMLEVFRLYGNDLWTSSIIRGMIDGENSPIIAVTKA